MDITTIPVLLFIITVLLVIAIYYLYRDTILMKRISKYLSAIGGAALAASLVV